MAPRRASGMSLVRTSWVGRIRVAELLTCRVQLRKYDRYIGPNYHTHITALGNLIILGTSALRVTFAIQSLNDHCRLVAPCCFTSSSLAGYTRGPQS